MWIYEHEVGVVAFPDVAPPLYSKELCGFMCHTINDFLSGEETLLSQIKHGYESMLCQGATTGSREAITFLLREEVRGVICCEDINLT